MSAKKVAMEWRKLCCIFCRRSACNRTVKKYSYHPDGNSVCDIRQPLCYWCFKGLEYEDRLNVIYRYEWTLCSCGCGEDYVNVHQYELEAEDDPSSDCEGENELELKIISYATIIEAEKNKVKYGINRYINIVKSRHNRTQAFLRDATIKISKEGDSRLARLPPEIVDHICSYI